MQARTDWIGKGSGLIEQEEKKSARYPHPSGTVLWVYLFKVMVELAAEESSAAIEAAALPLSVFVDSIHRVYPHHAPKPDFRYAENAWLWTVTLTTEASDAQGVIFKALKALSQGRHSDKFCVSQIHERTHPLMVMTPEEQGEFEVSHARGRKRVLARAHE